MIKACDYYAIQFVQSRYLLLWEKGLYRDIVKETFGNNSDIQVSYYDYGQGKGREETLAFFEKLGVDAQKNGSILRNDLPESQYIQVSPDRTTARGRWITMTGVIEGPAFGVEKPPYPYVYYIGYYDNRYIRQEDGQWKIQSISWRPILRVGDWTMDPAKGIGLYYTQPEKWPAPFPVSAIEDNASPKTQAVIDLRTDVMGFAHDYLVRGKEAVNSQTFATFGAEESALEMLDCTRFGFHGALMLVSPIVRMGEDLKNAEVYFNALHIKPRSGERVISRKGRIMGHMIQDGTGWKFDRFHFYRYNTLKPWSVRHFWPEHVGGI